MQDLIGMDDGTLAGRVTQTLADRIVAGDLAPGTPLRQDHLARELGVSHVPVREAFRRLEAQGLVVGAPRRGVRVAPLDPGAVREVAEMRAALELLALRHAVPAAGAADLDAAAAALERAARSDDVRVWEAANRDFHRALLAPCAMPRLMAALEGLYADGARYLFAAWRGLDWAPRSDDEHARILDAVRRGEVDRAGDLLRRHILAAGEAVAAALADRNDAGDAPVDRADEA